MSIIDWLFGKKKEDKPVMMKAAVEEQAKKAEAPTPDKLRQQLVGADMKLRASAATRLGQMRDLGAVHFLVRAIIDEMRQRMELADEYQAEIDRTGGWTPIGGTESIKRRRAEIESAAVAQKARDALTELGTPALSPLLEALQLLPEMTKSWNASSRSAVVQAFEEVIGLIGGSEAERVRGQFRSLMGE